MATSAQLKQMLRAARIATLKQRYLSLIEEARGRREKDERAYFQAANQAYITKRQGQKNAPQQMRALGLGGGRAREELAAVSAAYEDTMARLKHGAADSARAFEHTVEKQTRLMNSALAEHNARAALEDMRKPGRRAAGGAAKKQAQEHAAPGSGASQPPAEEGAVSTGRRTRRRKVR